MNFLTMIAGASIVLAAPVAAQDYSVGAGLTTLGPSIEGTYTIQPGLDIRGVIIGGLSTSDDFEYEDYNVDADARLGGVGILADYYFTGQGWRVSGGLFFSNSELTGLFTGPETFIGEAKFENEVAPIITVGYKYDFNSQWSVAGDIGAIASSIEISSDSLDPDVQAEIDELNAEADDYGFYPYLSLSVSYRF